MVTLFWVTSSQLKTSLPGLAKLRLKITRFPLIFFFVLLQKPVVAIGAAYT